MEISAEFACVEFGLFFPLDRAEPWLQRLLLQQVKLTTPQADKEGPLGSGTCLPGAALLENSACPQARSKTLIYSDLGKSQLLLAFTDGF